MLVHYTSKQAFRNVLKDKCIKRQEVQMPFLKEGKLSSEKRLLPVSTTVDKNLNLNYLNTEVAIFLKDDIKDFLDCCKVSYKAENYISKNGELKESSLEMLSTVLYIEDTEKFLKWYNFILDKKTNKRYIVENLQKYLNKYKDEKETLVYGDIDLKYVDYIKIGKINHFLTQQKSTKYIDLLLK